MSVATAASPAATPRSVAIGRAGLYLATFMAVFDIAVVYLALPSMERSIGASLSDQQWIASAYGLMEAGFTVAAGTLGDLYGRKRVYIIGVCTFILASIASGLAPNAMVLIGARFVQGIGGAIAMALPLALLVAMVDGEKATAAAIRTYATIAGMGAVTAPALGGLLVHALGWRSIFFVNVPVAAFVLYAAFAHTVESPRDPDKRLDLGGQITSALALLAFSFAVIEGGTFGWGSPTIVGAAALAIACAVAFVAIERRVACPMIHVRLLREPLLAAGVWALLLMNTGFFTLYLIASLFLQNVARLDALTAGWYLLSNNLLFFLVNQFSGPFVRRVGERAASLLGMGLGTLGLATFVFFRPSSPPMLAVLPLALCGLGWGLAFTPINALAMEVVPKSDDGLAAGMLSLGRPLGAVFGTAVFGSVLAAFMKQSLSAGLTSVHAGAAASAGITAAVRQRGLWSLLGEAQHFGVPTNALRASVDAGFVVGVHVSGVVAALASIGAIVYAAAAFRRRPVASAAP
ncbi:MAG: MFS transporter [Candidatus Baltobacteraceae bacterium]